ncbi:MAG: thioredoxin family protein [Akkermansiaceae bacterium]|nr:thioredoxin family protein [Akkermansiaceae bacterium]
MSQRFLPLLLIVLPLASCANRGGETLAFGQTPNAPTFTGQQNEGTNVTPGGNADMMMDPAGFTPPEDIVFTDPDDPDANIPELMGILTDPKLKRGPWERSIQIARKTSIREGKPLLIWFTDSNRSPRCRQLNQELFADREFQEWASENLIRMRVNESEELDDEGLSLGEKQSRRVAFAKYVKRLKKHYKVLGYPSLVMVDPQGRVVGHYRGYTSGQADLTWGKLRQGVVAANAATRAWKEQLERRGYRTWTDRKDRSLFAKLLKYDDGKLHIVEPDGSRSIIQEKQLSAEDREWIREQKAKHR